MLRSLLFLGFISAASLLLVLLLATAKPDARVAERRELVDRLGLTDLSIWSEARYTRHPSQADRFTAFQDYPGAFEHFPAGSIVGPSQPPQGGRLEIRKQEQR